MNRLLLDLDGVLADTHRGAVERGLLERLPTEWSWPEDERNASVDEVFCTPGIFRDAPLMDGAQDAVYRLSEVFDLWIVSSPWKNNRRSWTEKAEWVGHHLGGVFVDRLVLCHDKRLIPAVALVDDNPLQSPGPWTQVLYPRPWNDDEWQSARLVRPERTWKTGLVLELMRVFGRG